MKARQTIKSLLFAVAALGAMAVQNASASTYGFQNITNNSSVNVANQLSMDVSLSGTSALFKFSNNVGIASSIQDIYFDDVDPALITGINFSAIDSSSGVFFDNDASPSPGPGNLPGGNTISFTANYSGDAEKTGQGQSAVSQIENGVNKSTEWVSFLGTFASGNIDGLIAALNNGTFKVGLHVQSIDGVICPPGDLKCSDSDSFVNVSAVPLPAAAWLFGSALIGFITLSNRRKV